MKPSISIIIPVYNVEKYILRCLLSVTEQTYDGCIECIVIDDCGDDNSITLAERFIKDYIGNVDFKIIHNRSNLGVSASRNVALSKAQGDFIYFLDSDDYIESETIEMMVDILKRYPDSEIVQGNTADVEAGSYLSVERKNIPDYSEDRTFLKKSFIRQLYPVTPWNKLLKLDWIREHDLFFVEGIYHEDDEINNRFSKYAGHVAICHYPSYHYVENSNSILHNPIKEHKRYASKIKILGIYIDTIDSGCRKWQLLKIFKNAVELKKSNLSEDLCIELKNVEDRLGSRLSFVEKLAYKSCSRLSTITDNVWLNIISKSILFSCVKD